MVCRIVISVYLAYSTHFEFTCQSALPGFDILHAIGGIFNFRWAQSGIATTGPICTAQGVFYQFGMLGVPLITLVRLVLNTILYPCD
jgi:hypothetical protein